MMHNNYLNGWYTSGVAFLGTAYKHVHVKHFTGKSKNNIPKIPHVTACEEMATQIQGALKQLVSVH